MKESILDLIRSSPELLKMIYTDLAQPGVQQVGKALETALTTCNTILLPLKLFNERTRLLFKKNMNSYRERLKDVPEDKICDVSPEIGIPILEKFSYVTDESISDLFINLLVKASSSDTVDSAHPSFIYLINNLSGDEARILNYLKDKMEIPFICHYVLPKKASREGLHILGRYLTGIEFDVELLFPDNMKLYLANFVGLGLLVCNEEIMVDNFEMNKFAAEYNFLRERYSSYLGEYRSKHDKIDTDHGFYEITEYGQMFIKCCTKKVV